MAVGNGCQSNTVYPEDARTWNNLIRKQDTLKTGIFVDSERYLLADLL